MYVLTYSVNDYNQHGDYLLSVFNEKPTRLELREIMFSNYSPDKGCQDNNKERFISELLKIGVSQVDPNIGYFYNEYYLKELKHGQVYKDSSNS